MKKYTKLIIIALVSFAFFTCSTFLNVEEKSKEVIAKYLMVNDKVYALKSSELKRTLIWYYKGDSLYYHKIFSNKEEKLKFNQVEEIIVTKDTLLKYFEMSFGDDEYNCFYNEGHHSLGYDIYLYRKGKETLISGIDINCLFTQKFNINTFPYKLQKELYPLFQQTNFDFEKMEPLN